MPCNGQLSTLHKNELTLNDAAVRGLVDRDLPEYAHKPLKRLDATGSSNVLYRLGADLLVRLPRQPGGGASIAKEARWTPVLADALPVAVPQVVHVGNPGFGYPEQWSVVRWLEGKHPGSVPPGVNAFGDMGGIAEDLANVIKALREIEVPSPVGDELRWYRGGPLAAFDPSVRTFLNQCRSLTELDVDLDKAEALWNDSLALPGADVAGADRWYHGDLVSENLLVANGRLVAVLDLGAVSVGDPTVDLHGAWEVLDGPGRAVFAEKLGVSEAEWLRGRAWALGISLGALAYYWHTMPQRRHDRLAMLRNVLNDYTGVVWPR